MTETPQLRVVLPKEGRLERDVAALLSVAGFAASKRHPRLDFGVILDTNNQIPPLEFITQRPFDTLHSVLSIVAQVGIVGLDMLYEFAGEHAPNNDEGGNLIVAAQLKGCSACSLQIAGPEHRLVRSPEELGGLRIATAYPQSTSNWLRQNGVSACSIVIRQGSVEDTIRLGLADLICDLVNSGESLTLNGLAPYFKIYESTAVAITHVHATQSAVVDMFLDRLRGSCSTFALPRRSDADAEKEIT